MTLNIYWGDIHNHNSMGYAKGSMERSLDIASSSLDFYGATGHSQWHDIKEYESDVHKKWINGFKIHRDNWEKIQQMIYEANKPGEFVTFLGYEWHSNTYGDYCLIYKDDFKDLVFSKDIYELREHASRENALLIPHHIGYKRGNRGFNMDVLDTKYSPVVEIYSEHGLCETDDGPFEMISHSMGGRLTDNTYQKILEKGHIIGAVASTDDHLGYPGAYGEGLMAVYADKLDRESIWDGIWNRRTYGVTGDRIKLNFSINDNIMGSVINGDRDREIKVDVDCWDTIWMVEVIKNNKVIYRGFADETPDHSGKTMKIRVEYGWGPWSDLSIPRTCDWKFIMEADNCKIREYCPCFQSGPFDEDRRNKITSISGDNCSWVSYTSRKDAYMQRATNGIVFEVDYDHMDRGKLTMVVDKPVEMAFDIPLKTIAEKSMVEFTGDFPKESIKIHRGVAENMYKRSFEFIDRDNRGQNPRDFYYVRVTQKNGHMAVSSPIWVKN